MTWKHIKAYSEKIWGSQWSPYIFLLTIIALVFLIPSLIQTGTYTSAKIEVFFSLIMLIGAFTVPCSPLIRFIAFGAVGLTIAIRSVGEITDYQSLKVAEITLSILMLCLYIYIMIRHFLAEINSTRQRLVGAISIYLIVGLIWARLYELLMVFNPISLIAEHYHGLPTMIYFSFVTLATIGYGDVVPVTSLARNLSIMEGIVGQLYLIIFISSLVSEKFAKGLNGK
jgi:hypothetical protein